MTIQPGTYYVMSVYKAEGFRLCVPGRHGGPSKCSPKGEEGGKWDFLPNPRLPGHFFVRSHIKGANWEQFLGSAYTPQGDMTTDYALYSSPGDWDANHLPTKVSSYRVDPYAGAFLLIHDATGMVLDYRSDEDDDGERVKLNNFLGVRQQLWTLEPA